MQTKAKHVNSALTRYRLSNSQLFPHPIILHRIVSSIIGIFSLDQSPPASNLGSDHLSAATDGGGLDGSSGNDILTLGNLETLVALDGNFNGAAERVGLLGDTVGARDDIDEGKSSRLSGQRSSSVMLSGRKGSHQQ